MIDATCPESRTAGAETARLTRSASSEGNVPMTSDELENLTPVGRLIRLTGCVRFYRDGQAISQVFRIWHPVTWMVWVVALQICGFIGEPISNVVPLALSPYWKARRDKIEWV